MTVETEGFQRLLERSTALAADLEVAFSLPPFEGQARFEATVVAASLAAEHGSAVRVLLGAGLGVSAAVVLRAQYEATLRAVWLCYSAKPEQVQMLHGDLTPDSERQAKGLPQAADMLAELAGKAPEAALISLTNFRAQSWAALNSFVHAGLHSLNRHKVGLPLAIAEGALRSSNGLSLMVAVQAAVATGSQALASQVAKAQVGYSDCFS